MGQTLGPLIESLGAGGDPTGNFQYESEFLNGGPRAVSPGLEQLNSQIEAARQQSQELNERRSKIKDKIDKKNRKKEKKAKRDGARNSPGDSSDQNSSAGMSEGEQAPEALNGVNGGENGANGIPPEMLPSEKVLKEEEAERLAEEERKKNREQPIIFKEVDVSRVDRFVWRCVW